jgi:hypothetical protein
LDITFIGPPGLIVARAQPGLDGRTTQATFSTYVNPTPPRSIDLINELVITAEIARRGTNADLRELATRNFVGSYTVTSLVSRKGILLEGDFQSGPRKFVLIERGPDHILLLSAFPRNSSRMAIFDQLLATLVVR